MRDCFSYDADAKPDACAGAARPTSPDCERRLIALWNEAFAPRRWSTHRQALPDPKASPFEQSFNADERQGTFYRLVECPSLRLMLKRCELMLQTAQSKGADATVMNFLRDRIQPHKLRLREELATSLGEACRCFELAARAARVPACVQCGRQVRRTSERESDCERLRCLLFRMIVSCI